MRTTTAWILLFALLVADSNLAEAQTGTTLSRHATKVKHKVTNLGVRATVIVVRKSGPDLQGRIESIEDSTFTVADVGQNQPVTVAYEDVRKLDTDGTIVATGRKTPNPHKSVIIGACVMGGLVAFLAIALSNKTF